MTSQSVRPDQPSMRSKDEIIANYNNRQSAQKVQEAIESAGLPIDKVAIDDRTSLRSKLEAMGTITGGAAGFWMGAFYGGVLGVIIVPILAYWNESMYANSNFNRLLILGLTVGGAVLGAFTGKAAFEAQPQEQKDKTDPNASNIFRVVVRAPESSLGDVREIARKMDV